MRGAQTAKVPAFHATGKTLADRRAGNIDKLADNEVVSGNFGADGDERVFADAELGELALGLDLGNGKMPALGLADRVRAAFAGAELERDIAVLVLGAVTNDLTIAQLQHGDRNMLAGVREHPRHPHLLCDHTGTHRNNPFSARD